MHKRQKRKIALYVTLGVAATLLVFFFVWSPQTADTEPMKDLIQPAPKADTTSDKPATDRFEKGPLTRQELGHRTWSYLHTLASNYPIEAGETEEDKLKIIYDFLQLFGKLYPCSTCGRHFREMIGEHPPPLKGTRADFELWLCERHNQVNRRLEKPEFDCTLDSIRDRYEQTDGCPLE